MHQILCKDAIGEFFDLARKSCPQRFALSLINLVIVEHEIEGKLTSYRTVEEIDHWTVEQFGTYFFQVAIPLPDELESLKNRNFMIRLQLLAYAQFWECSGIKRLFYLLMGTIKNKEFDTQFESPQMATGAFWKQFIDDCESEHLGLANVLRDLYDNDRRNAFVHSDFLLPMEEGYDYITFGHPMLKDNKSKSLLFDEWAELFEKTKELVIAIFSTRVEEVRELKANIPFRIDRLDGVYCSPLVDAVC